MRISIEHRKQTDTKKGGIVITGFNQVIAVLGGDWIKDSIDATGLPVKMKSPFGIVYGTEYHEDIIPELPPTYKVENAD